MEFPSLFLPLFFTVLLLLLLKKRGGWLTTQTPAPKLPPGPWQLPILGNMHSLFGGLPHRFLRDLALKYGPIMHLRLGHVSTVIISSPKMAKQIMKTHDLTFATRPKLLSADFMTYGGKDVAFAPYGDYWRQMRKICTLELFSPKRVVSFRSIREEEAKNLIQSIYASSDSPVNLTEKIYTYTNNFITRAATGQRCRDREQFLLALREAIQVVGGFSLSDLFPSLKFLPLITGMKSRMLKTRRKLGEILDDLIEEHKREGMTGTRNNEGGSEGEDLIHVLLGLQRDGGLQLPITALNIRAVLLDMFGAGTDTSSSTVEWAMSEMMRNPRVMKEAQAEVRQALKGKSKMEEADTNDLHFLKLVIMETLRLHPPSPLLLPRECREACEIDGYDIPIKTRVIVNAWAIGRDPHTWDDPESFKPERFDGSEIDYKGFHFEFIPFGAGRRICPGVTIGMANVILPLAQLLYYFDWKLPNGMKDLDMTEVFGATVSRKSKLYLIPISCIPLPK